MITSFTYHRRATSHAKSSTHTHKEKERGARNRDSELCSNVSVTSREDVEFSVPWPQWGRGGV